MQNIYAELLVKIADGNQMATDWQPSGNQMETQYRLGKDSVDKGSVVEAKASCPEPEADSTPPAPPSPKIHFGLELTAAFEDWLEYKKEKHQPYKPKGLQSLVAQIEKKAGVYGESAVAGLIVESMANGWQGIIWDRLEKQQPRHGPQEREKSWAELARELEAGKYDV